MTHPNHEVKSAPRRRTDHRSRPAVGLASTVCALAVLPTIATLMMAIGAVASMFTAPHGQWHYAVPFLVFPVAYAAAALIFHRMLQSTTVRKTWLWATLFIVLVGASSTPAVWVTADAIAEEWCESQPGGRGYTSDSSIAEIPRACR